MRSLNKKTGGILRNGILPRGADRRSLPRIVQRPLFLGERVAENTPAAKRPILAATLVSAMIILGGAYLAKSESGQALVGMASAKLGFSIREIRISGTDEILRNHVRTELDIAKDTSILTYDVHAARNRLNELAWVRNVNVTKVYPDTISVEIAERSAYALWQISGKIFVIERDGKIIIPFEEKFADLPLVVGKDANKEAANLIAALELYPAIEKEVKAMIRVAGRRWDLDMKNGVKVMLPESGVRDALHRFAELEAKHDLTKREVVAVDLRIDSQMVLRLTQDGMKRRKADGLSTQNVSEKRI